MAGAIAAGGPLQSPLGALQDTETRRGHGDNGAGLGASHQTGWTGVVAKLIQLFGLLDAQKLLEAGKDAAFTNGTPAVSQRRK